MERAEAETAIQAITVQREQVEAILFDFVESRDAVRARHRFDRWKERTITVIADHISSAEAGKFQKTYVPVAWGMGEIESVIESIRRHEAALDVLQEELRDHPESLSKVEARDKS